jgi:hypothetical protein
MVDALKVFPDEAADTRVVGYALFGAIGKDMSSFGFADRNIVYVEDRCIGNFGL